jgi:hypothetical protein
MISLYDTIIKVMLKILINYIYDRSYCKIRARLGGLTPLASLGGALTERKNREDRKN